MIDIDLTYRDKYGKITYGFKKNSTNTGIEILLQKVTTLLLSETKTTYFGTIVGGNISKVGMYNFNSDDFKVNLTDAILNIKKKVVFATVNNKLNKYVWDAGKINSLFSNIPNEDDGENDDE